MTIIAVSMKSVHDGAGDAYLHLEVADLLTIWSPHTSKKSFIEVREVNSQRCSVLDKRRWRHLEFPKQHRATKQHSSSKANVT